MSLRFLKTSKRGAAIALVLCLALMLATSSWRSGRGAGMLEDAVSFLTTPLLDASAGAAGFLEGTWDFFFGWRNLKEENRRLRKELARARRVVEEGRERELAYRRLEEALRFREATGYEMSVAAVIGRDATNLFRTILVNKGRKDGISRNMAVVTPDGVVGRTIKVYEGSARVLLLTDRSSGIDAIVQRTRDQGVVRGLGLESCEMKYLSRQSTVAVGDAIVTSGMAGVFPKGMIVGTVASVNKGGYLLQKVEVNPTAALDRLEEVIFLHRKSEGS